jgi:hypothetical protein
MKLRHAAALALVGWYLMIPPFAKKDGAGNWHADPSAPLSNWHFYHESSDRTDDQAHGLEFKTYDECERKRKEIYDGWFGTNGHRGLRDILEINSLAIEGRTEVVTEQKCIASDNPSLKAKIGHPAFQIQTLKPN